MHRPRRGEGHRGNSRKSSSNRRSSQHSRSELSQGTDEQTVNRRYGSSEARRGRPVRHHGDQDNEFHYKRVLGLCSDNIDSVAVAEILSKNLNDLKILLKSRPNKDFILLILKLFQKVTACPFVKMKVVVLGVFLELSFVEYLTLFILKEVNPKTDKAYCTDFLSALSSLFDNAVSLVPHMAENLLPIITHCCCISAQLPNFESECIQFNKQKQQLEAFVKSKFEKKSTEEGKQSNHDYESTYVPNDFRTISLYPEPEDLTGRNFIRSNIVEGQYVDNIHYLDIQFRLLREDFMDPIRQGIDIYKNSINERSKVKNFYVKIYKNVQLCRMWYEEKRPSDICVLVSLDPKFVSKIKWEHSKRLIYGSLLLLTSDDFKSFFLATVYSKDDKKLKKGEFLINLINHNVSCIDWNIKYVMAESTVFYEPYHQVLKCLQDMSYETRFPMEKYLLVKNPIPNIPPYLAYIDNNDLMAGNRGLNLSQRTAYVAALRDDFVVIQGPPGTGKTYLGLKIVTKILEFSDVLNSPIVIVCYTNHALDQFLESLSKKTNKIIRIGGQCKNEAIARYNLNKIIRTRSLHKNSRDIVFKVRDIQATICGIQQKLFDLDKPGLINCDRLDFIDDDLSILNDISEFTGGLSFNKFLLPSAVFDSIQIINNILSGELQNIIIGKFSKDLKFLGNRKEDMEKDSTGKLPSDEDISDEEEEMRRASEILDAFESEPLNKKLTSCTEQTNFIVTLENIKNAEFMLEDLVYKCNAYQKEDPNYELSHIFLQELIGYFPKLNLVKSFVDRIMTYKDYNIDDNTVKLISLSSKNDRANKHKFEYKGMLYFYVLKKIRIILQNKIMNLQKRLSSALDELKEIDSREKYQAIKFCKPAIVGLTTTGAARYRSLLQALSPKLVVVEEAAECLESHVVVALSESVEHVILIGDHKQLKPNPATYNLAKKFGLDISLFERMLKNGLNCYSLDEQHRMRPEISSLVIGTIYDNLKNAESVNDYPQVLGMKKNLFFLDHQVFENEVDEFSSHSNIFEATFMISLCKYLLRQGYSDSQITILTTYSSQLLELKRRKKAYPSLSNVRITIVDNFQGEENDIILLSLVRSNESANVGFLATENRICVALSRAKIGFYIIGNMQNLTQASKTWRSIKDKLLLNESIGPALPLSCQVHGKETNVSCSDDFWKVPEGGCDELCRRIMPCTHTCSNFCHPDDLEHKSTKCLEPCIRTKCGYPNHPCPLKCFEECMPCIFPTEKRLPCGHIGTMKCHINPESYKCPIIVDDVKPVCNHPLKRMCHQNINRVPCPEPCKTRLDCGHACIRSCHAENDPHHVKYLCKKDCAKINLNCKENHPCTRRCHEDCGLCEVQVIFNLECGHTHRLNCSVDLSVYKCTRDCEKKLPCDHMCKKKCFEECGACPEKVKKIINECGHDVKVECHYEPFKYDCKSRNCKAILPCGHKCAAPCKEDCSVRDCKVLVPAAITLGCGHKASVPCYMLKTDLDPWSDDLMMFCPERCNTSLPCGHVCKGTCGSCMQGRIHKPCDESCGNVLICGHQCNVPCRDDCPPCKKKCLYKCAHSVCQKKCGEPCTKCKEQCQWACVHKKCSQKCGAICDRDPCYEPCLKLLECKHQCVGFCGEPCPPLCRVCHAEELQTILLGNEDDEDARFVLLQDCGHTIESTGLERWMALDNENQEIGFKSCPQCKTLIMNTSRFINYTKKTMQKIEHVRKKIFGVNKENQEKEKDLNSKFVYLLELRDELSKRTNLQYLNVDTLSKILNRLRELFLPKKQQQKNQAKNSISTTDLNLASFLIESCSYCLQLYDKFYDQYGSLHFNMCMKRLNLLLYHISLRRVKISSNEVKQFENELKRLPLFLKICKVNRKFDNKTKSLLLSISVLTPDQEKEFDHLLKYANVITAEERKMIHLAMSKSFHSNKQGHWFSCSKGHIYVITECGGAMERGICPECKEVIGGGSHRVVSTSRLASIMDGATHPAWSEGNNYVNYQF